MTGGRCELSNCKPEHIYSLIGKLSDNACKIECFSDKIIVSGDKRLNSVQLFETSPYPGFPTDLQPQAVVLQAISEGTSVVIENMFETRFKHINELNKMGASITVRERMAIVRGVPGLFGAEVTAYDLRGGAALVLAGLAAKGKTTVNDVYHVDRGYFELERTLSGLGADIKRIS
jgi:UDP-N-acetylglucosamine 1-carboxyvinyltransferase